MHLSKERRRTRLETYLDRNPFFTDEDLAAKFEVSIQTIRLDRQVLGIPDVRERIKRVAEDNFDRVRSLSSGEIVGRLLDLKLGSWAMSVMETDEEMVFQKTRIVRSHFIFAQADSLALAVIDADVAVTGLVNVKYKRPVTVGEELLARAEVIRRKGRDKHVVLVETTSGEQKVFRAKFVVFVLDEEEEDVLENRAGYDGRRRRSPSSV